MLLSCRCIFWNLFLTLSRPIKTWTSKVSIDVYLTYYVHGTLQINPLI